MPFSPIRPSPSAGGIADIWALRQTRPLTYAHVLVELPGGRRAIRWGTTCSTWRSTWARCCWPSSACRRLLPERAALVAAALFAVHPMQAEAVDYVWARSIVLAALLCFASLLSVARRAAWVAVAWFAAALLAKEEVRGVPPGCCWRARSAQQRRGAHRGHARCCRARGAAARVIYATRSHAGSARRVSGRHHAVALPARPGPGDPAVSAPADASPTASPSIRRSACPPVWVGPRWRGARSPRLVRRSWTRAPCGRVAAGGIAAAAAQLFDLPRRRSRGRPPHVPAALRLRRGRGPAAGTREAEARGAGAWWPRAGAGQRDAHPGVDVGGSRCGARRCGARPARFARRFNSRARCRRPGPGTAGQAAIQAPYDPAVAAETGRVCPGGTAAGCRAARIRAGAGARSAQRANLNNRGVALEALGQSEAARLDFERALALDPDLAEARENLEKLTGRGNLHVGAENCQSGSSTDLCLVLSGPSFLRFDRPQVGGEGRTCPPRLLPISVCAPTG